MPTKILITAGDTNLWEKLEAIEKIDPAISGGIESIVHGHRLQTRGTPIAMLFSAGYEEVHEIEAGFCAHITDAVIDQDWRLAASSVDHTLRFRIAFEGEAGYVARESRVSDASARCSFIIRPPGESLTANFKGEAAYRYCSLSLTMNYLRNTLGLTDEHLPGMLTNYWARRETVMGHFPASKTSLLQASRFFNIRLPGPWHDLTIKTLALDLLRLLFQDWQSSRPGSRTSIRITPTERSHLLKIREQIETDPASPITLAALCARTRMNRNKLHFGFKQQFGVSIHEYQTERRMQAALALLETTDLSIGQIAERTGYGEPTNFTAAFKRHFAALPREVRGARKRT
ncbi:MAG TPA: AraC family transcriptional regulator [Steroidobacteraceae bacterium]|nr:AraC family transcriptional regulator [Steroidobacteraceae bacterium]